MSEETAYNLAAIQLQAEHGLKDEKYYSKGVANDPFLYLPYEIAKSMANDSNICEQKILLEHKKYKNLDKTDCYRKYIETIRNDKDGSEYFGNVFFKCVKVSRLKRQTAAATAVQSSQQKQKQQQNEDVLIGISENGLIFVNPLTMQIFEKYSLESILTYGFRVGAFLMVAGTLMTHKKFQFATMHVRMFFKYFCFVFFSHFLSFFFVLFW